MSTNKAHPHAESMKLYAEDAAETDKPWERWEFRRPELSDRWMSFKGLRDQLHPTWIDVCEYRRKPTEAALLQGHTMEQWEFIREQGFDCEFSDNRDFTHSIIGKLSGFSHDALPIRKENDEMYLYCRPRRAKGIKQPWFGGERPVDPEARVLVCYRDESFAAIHAMYGIWEHRGSERDTVAFIEL